MASTPPTHKHPNTRPKHSRMSSASIANMNVDQLLAERSKIDAAIKNLGASAEGSTKEKKGKKKGGPAGPWAAWTTHCTKVAYVAEIAAFKEAAESKLGAHLKWISANAGKDSAEYKAFAAQFALDHPKGSSASAKTSVVGDEEDVASCVSGSGDEAKAPEVAKEVKKRGAKKLADMTPEELAAHHAKVAAKRAAKAEAKAPAAEEAPVVAAPTASAEESLGGGAAGGGSDSLGGARTLPASAPAPEAEEAEAEWLQFELDGTKYFRLGVKKADGSVLYEPDLWRVNKKTGARGPYVGALLEDGSIDADAEEPNLA